MADDVKRTIDEIDAEDPEVEALLDAEAEADIAAGRTVPHDEVMAWLKSWGTPNELPCPTPKPR